MPRVLVIDDDQPQRRLISKVLSQAGYEAQEASGGIEGLRLFRQHPADLVITDIVMPDMDGVAFMTGLHQEFPGVRVVAMSSGGLRSSEDWLTTVEQLGARRAISKPILNQQLLAAVQEALAPE